jgi:hypothetical protein
MDIHLKLIGVLLIALSLLHLSFPRQFNWTKELSSLSLMNREMMYVHTFFIALVIFLSGMLCLTSAEEIAGTMFGKKIALGLAIFWGIRLIVQFFGYSSALWKGKRFETAMHVIFSVLWLYLSVVFTWTYLS